MMRELYYSYADLMSKKDLEYLVKTCLVDYKIRKEFLRQEDGFLGRWRDSQFENFIVYNTDDPIQVTVIDETTGHVRHILNRRHWRDVYNEDTLSYDDIFLLVAKNYFEERDSQEVVL